MRWKPLTFALLLFAAAFAVRLATVHALRDLRVGPVGPCSADDVEFNNLALRLAAGDGFAGENGRPTSFRAPGWPLFLAPFYAAFGPCYPLAYVLLCVLGALSCVLTYLLAGEVVSEGLARLAGCLAAVYLPHAWFATLFLSENLFVPLLLLGLWLFVRHLKSRSGKECPSLALQACVHPHKPEAQAKDTVQTGARRSSPGLLALAGLVLGFATLTRPFALLLLPLLLGVLAVAWRRERRPLVVPALVFTAAFVACIVPWTVRNRQVHGRFVLIATNGGSTFYGGNNSRVVREWRMFGNWISTTELPYRDRIEATPDEVSHDKMEWQLGMDWLRNHPGSVPLLLVLKTGRLCLWLPDFDGGSRLFLVLRVAMWAPFLVLLACGAWACLRDRSRRGLPWLALHGTLLATFATAWIFWGSPRFRDANLGLLMIYAAVGAERLYGRLVAVSVPRRAACEPSRRQAACPANVSVC
jgi:4-amino-4-deoxy-L-arabinose transferase-like glycosyltransferase